MVRGGVEGARRSSVCGVTLRSYAADIFALYEKCLVLGRFRIGIVARRRDQIHKSARGAPRIFSNPAEAPTEGNSDLVDTFSVHLERPNSLGDHRPANVSASGSGDADGIAGAYPKIPGHLFIDFGERFRYQLNVGRIVLGPEVVGLRETHGKRDRRIAFGGGAEFVEGRFHFLAQAVRGPSPVKNILNQSLNGVLVLGQRSIHQQRQWRKEPTHPLVDANEGAQL